MKVLVTGADGMLGDAVKAIFKDEWLILTDKQSLDVANWREVKQYADHDLKLILHLGAETDLEQCEKDPGRAYYTNGIGTINMGELAHMKNIPIVYISTAGVFGGENKAFTEEDTPNPSNHYGRSKLQGEVIRLLHKKVWIFRNGWAFGGGQRLDKKFVNKIYTQLKKTPDKIYAIDNVFGCPTYTWDLAKTIRNAIDMKIPFGTYHSAGIGSASRYDVAKFIVDTLEIHIPVIPVKNGFFKSAFPCPRAESEIILNDKLIATGACAMRDWREALHEYLLRWFA